MTSVRFLVRLTDCELTTASQESNNKDGNVAKVSDFTQALMLTCKTLDLEELGIADVDIIGTILTYISGLNHASCC